ncbi:TPA: DUF551 domain-containing protein [Klebsiella michiganensis]|nr:DUF551 domain-containing protein [Klebsiella michiganensis]
MKFEEWLSQQDGVIEVDCGCVTTEAFYHWMRLAYEAGNSPVIPDGYMMVPKEPTDEMIAAAMNCDDVLFNSDESFCVQFGNIYEAMLAAAPHDTHALNSLQSVATVPGKWIPVSERMPETDGNYWGWWSESKRQGPVWFIKSELQAQFQSNEITHWMPLPAAPQEPKP